MITHAFLHIPIFREILPISKDVNGKWTIDEVPPVTYKALGHDRFTVWKKEVLEFVDRGRISGTPEGLVFELLAAPDPNRDWLTLQALGGEVVKLLTAAATDEEKLATIKDITLKLDLIHHDPAGTLIAGMKPKVTTD